jgi:dethiobiotin synthetase
LQKIIFITGTDTGVGKTVLTALLLSHLRQSGVPALAIKPFCSGGRDDAQLLHTLQPDEITLDAINPFYFSEPLAPLVAARNEGRHVPFHTALHHLRARLSLLSKIENRKSKIESPTLLIEGAGGLLSPLGEPKSPFKVQGSKFKVQGSYSYSALDLIKALNSRVILVAPNRLGTINHTLLTVRALPPAALKELKVVLIDILPPRHSTLDTHSNPSLLTQFLAPVPLYTLPYLGSNLAYPTRIKRLAKKLEHTLGPILQPLSR